MKKLYSHYFIILFLLSLFQAKTFAQDECETEYILPLLNSEIDYERSQAVELIVSCNKIDLLPDLVNSFYSEQQLYIKQTMLEALHRLDPEHSSTFAYDFLDAINSFEKDTLDDEYYSKLIVTNILFDSEDYSTYQYIFDFVENRFDKPAILALQLLSKVIDYLPQYSEVAKRALEDYEQNSSLQNMRAIALTFLVHHYSFGYESECISKFYNDESYIVRNTAFQLLTSLNVSGLNGMLKERLSQDSYWSLRALFADTLLKKYGEPSDLKAVIDYQPNEPDETARSLMVYSINEFIPPKPDTDYYGLCTRLITYTDEMFVYNWIHNEETKDYYAQRLKEVYESIENSGEIGYACAVIDERILQQLEQDLAGELITIEGYKFLHYYTIYIKEEIEEEYGPCP
jgi:hypothetical protein